MANFNYSISLDENGNVKKRVRLIKYNSKILAFSIEKPSMQFFFDSVDEFLETAKGCESSIFDDLTGENIFSNGNSVYSNLKSMSTSSANALALRIIPEKQSQLQYD
jgi:hypothetical protein